MVKLRTLTLPVEAGKIAEFARAIRDENPIYYDEAAARAAGFAGIPVPPTFYEIWLRFGEFLPSEDQDRQRTMPLSESGGGVLDGGRDIEYFKPMLAGDVITMTQRAGETYEREGRRGGKLTFSVIESVFTNQRGEKVLVVRATGIFTSQVARAH